MEASWRGVRGCPLIIKVENMVTLPGQYDQRSRCDDYASPTWYFGTVLYMYSTIQSLGDKDR